MKILDLGTGTGCILVSLLKNLPNATGVGVDISPESIEISKRNAARHGVDSRADFILSDWTNNIQDKYDIIVSNPPRIPTRLVPELVREVAEYDPVEALDGGRNGLDFYSRLAADFRRISEPEAVCIIQIGNIILNHAIKIFRNAGFCDLTIMRDYKYSPNCIYFKNSEEQASIREKLRKNLYDFFRV